MLVDREKIAAALPSYEVGRQFGSGGFGLVLEGRHRSLGRRVAIKVLTTPEPAVERRFLAEAQVMAAFDHPHVVRVHDYADHEGLCLLVLEHCPGGTLSDRLDAPVRPETACAITLAVADALHAAHARGIIHRDVKPDNVLFAEDGAAKVTDFGLAKIYEGSVVTSGSLVGTPGYAAPEQILGQPVRPASDVYALGGVAYHLLSGRPPFPEGVPIAEMLHRQLHDSAPIPVGMPPRFAEVVGRALRRDVAARTPSAQEFAVALASAATAELGPGWLMRAEVPLRVEEEVRQAATAVARAGRTDVTVASRTERRPRRADRGSAPGSGRSAPAGTGRHAAPEAEDGPRYPSGPSELLSTSEVRRRIDVWASHADEGPSRRTLLLLLAGLAVLAALSIGAGAVVGSLQR
ncbi:serine/threonine-protein kinase [Cryptosporangium phraense]|uniref:non-specific serine/threonine protein kinase n=1 Tax=Cryptosporangium phraense TaxID=2593070 RepID=A0A545ATZ2_9ACTN|nr:serine/threonine-protein kinase [Cryptosporangium phraense]TQS44763.1 serine/threonine protein kinase [Cryptosporangium phraense]